MNTIVKILLYLAKLVNAWVFTIPAKFNILASIMYIGIMYLFFGTPYMNEIIKIVGEGGVAHVLLVVFLGVPFLISFASIMAPEFDLGNNINRNLDSLFVHRNNMMRNSSAGDAYEIMKNTAHLDVMRSSPEFRDAVIGFDATVGKEGTSKIYNDLMKG